MTKRAKRRNSWKQHIAQCVEAHLPAPQPKPRKRRKAILRPAKAKVDEMALNVIVAMGCVAIAVPLLIAATYMKFAL